jgi:transcriptional regulator of acetoin/glycerol metabolism/DNA-binding CsgD family transcriptional regulator
MTETRAPPPDGTSSTLRAVLDRSEGAGGRAGLLRDEIAASWQRCARAGLRPERFEVPYDADVDDRGRLCWAAGPVLDQVGGDLDGTGVGILLTDQRARVLARREADHDTAGLLDRVQLAPGFGYREEQIGTNAIGTAIAGRGLALVAGHEHFADALTHLACAAVTVTDPATGRVIGVVDVTCTADDASPLMLPLVKRAAWEIGQRLLDDSSAEERILQEHFLRARRTSKGPVLALSRRTMLVNGAATGIIEPADRELLWDSALRSLASGQQQPFPVPLASGRQITIRCEPVLDGIRLVGVLVRPRTASEWTGGDPPQRNTATTPAHGWSSLTGTQVAVAEQVAQGLTNREAAAHLYLSPHTIDYHLRQVFQKLDVRSRVELTQALLRRQAELPR